MVEEGETIPGDGDVIEGVAYVNEAAITGQSAPVLKEPGTDIRSSVTGRDDADQRPSATRVTTDPGEDFPDRMIALVKGRSASARPTRSRLPSCWRA